MPNGLNIFLLIGQSNMAGRGKLDDVSELVHPDLFMFRAGQWLPAAEPLHTDKPRIAGVGLGMSFAYVISILRQRPQTDQTLQLWQKLLARMQRKGLDIPAWFGPKQVLVAASERWPDQRVALQKIVRLYIHLRYGRAQRSRQEKKLQRAIQRLKLN